LQILTEGPATETKQEEPAAAEMPPSTKDSHIVVHDEEKGAVKDAEKEIAGEMKPMQIETET